jgi:hypothetical protein
MSKPFLLASVKMGYNNLSKIAKALPRESDAIVQNAATALRGEIIIRIKQGPKTGRMYRRGRKYHRASSGGESPADDTGHLASTVQKRKIGLARAMVYVGSENGLTLEYGSVYMEKRPFVRPAAKKIRPEMIEAFRNLEGRLRWVQ